MENSKGKILEVEGSKEKIVKDTKVVDEYLWAGEIEWEYKELKSVWEAWGKLTK